MNYKKAGAQHYIKWCLTADLSLRFYFLFQDRKEYEGKYFLKSHSTKEYQKVEGEKLIKELKTMAQCTAEIFGRNLPDGTYRKFISDGIDFEKFEIYNEDGDVEDIYGPDFNLQKENLE